MLTTPPAATQADTIEALLDRSNRDEVPIRKTFVQQGSGKVRDPGPLAGLVSRRDERALDLYLLVHAIISAAPFYVALSAAVWARAIGLSDSKSARSVVSKAFRRLGDLGLVERDRAGGRARVTLLDEGGHQDPYTRPTGRPAAERFFKLPHAYWEQDWHLRLSLRAKAVLLIALSLDDGFVLPTERAPAWYSISADTVQRGIAELEAADLLDVATGYKTAPLAPAGFTQERRFTLRSPFGPLRQPLASITELLA